MYASFWEFLKVALLSPTLILYIPALPLILGSVSLSLSYLFAYFFSDVFPGHPGLFSSFIISSNNFSTFPHPPSPVYYKFQINLCLLSYCFLVFFSFKCVTFFFNLAVFLPKPHSPHASSWFLALWTVSMTCHPRSEAFIQGIHYSSSPGDTPAFIMAGVIAFSRLLSLLF